MKEITIISGKGGTGKTTVTAALANIWANKVLVDCDVDAANLHLALHPQVLKTTDFYSGKKAEIDLEACTSCGRCKEVCRFKAIDADFRIDDLSCTGCGACTLVCPAGAVKLHSNLAGQWFVSETRVGTMVHAALGIAEDNSGKLVAQIRQVAKQLAEEKQLDTILIDGPPGIGCPVISAITGVNLVLVVTEPSLSGLHDLKRIITLTKNFGIKALVCINKYDLNPDLASEITAYCGQEGYPLVGKIPFHKGVVEGMANLSPKEYLLQNLPDKIKENIYSIYSRIQEYM